jgi:hypothetical protein
LDRPHHIHLSLLSEKEKRWRNFRFTDKYVWYSAACLLVALGLITVTSYRMKNAMEEKQKDFDRILEEAKKSDSEVKDRLGAIDKKVSKVDAMLLRVSSSQEVFDLLRLLSDPKIVPDQVNLVEIQVDDLDPLPFRKEAAPDADETPSERTVDVSGQVRTVVPPPIDPEKPRGGEPVEPQREDYQACLKTIEQLCNNLMGVSEVVYKARVTRAETDPRLEKAGKPLNFGIRIELAPKTVEAREMQTQLAQEAKGK